jgi:hypothetical protein
MFFVYGLLFPQNAMLVQSSTQENSKAVVEEPHEDE